ncbi:MAG: TonB-dependent receptor [Cyanobacteria bacterium P01_H01_bin.130]
MKLTVSKLSGVPLRPLGGSLRAINAALARSPVAHLEDERSPQSEPGAIAQASPLVTITEIELESTDSGVQITLETEAGPLAEPDRSRVVGNALILEIPNATLADPEFEEFQPADGIALIQAVELPGDRVQISITGADAPPTVEVSATDTGLSLAVTRGVETLADADEAIQLDVTGQTEGYAVPNASVGTRTDTPLRDVPQSIQVIPREILEDQGLIRLSDAIRNVSGVTTGENEPRGQRFTIRGFASSSVLRDGVRLNNNIGFAELANIERIEVLKGPAGVLFGSLQPGGVINLVSKQPLAEPRYELSLRGGSRELIEPSIDFSGPLTRDGRVRYRLNALYRSEDYYRDYDNRFERFFISPVVSIALNEKTDLTVELEYRNDERPSDFGLVAIGDRVADIPLDRALSNRDDVATTEALRLGYRFEHRFDEDWKIRNSLYFNRFDTSVFVDLAGRLVNAGVVPFAVNDETGDLLLFPGRLDQPTSGLEVQTNVVGKFSTGALDHTLLAGVDYFSRRDRGSDLFAEPPGPDAFGTINIFDPDYSRIPSPDFDDLEGSRLASSRSDNFGVYVQDQIKIGDNWIILAGLRFDATKQTTESGEDETELNESEWTPRIGVVYQPSDDISLYASYSRSFTPNGATTVDGAFVDPERGEQFEVGARAELFNDNLLINLSLFSLEKENIAVPDPDNFGFAIPSGKQRSQGIELDIIGEILPGWNIVANYAYTDTEILESTTGTTGNRLFNSPEHQANLWTTYEIQSGSLEGLSFGLGFNYVGERFGDLDNSFQVDDYFLTNAVVAYERNNWKAAVNFRNLFDIDFIESVANSRTGEIFPGEGFTVVGSFSIRF